MKRITKLGRKIFTSFILLMLAFMPNNLFAQFVQYDQLAKGATGGERFEYMLHDKFVENRIYGILTDHHPRILVSEDNGATWRLLYHFTENMGFISRVMLNSDSKWVSFCLNNLATFDAESRGVHSVNIETKEVRNYPLPNPEDGAFIGSFDVYGITGDTLLIETGFLEFTEYGIKTTKVYYSVDGGQSYDLVYWHKDHDAIHVNNVAISPNDPKKLFLARGLSPFEKNGGLYISEDAGKNWTQSLPGITFGPIAFHPNNPDEVMIGTWIASGAHDEFIYRTTDGGKSWNQVNVPEWSDQILNYVTSIKYDLTEPNKIVITEENEVLLTDDGGNTWTKPATPVQSGDFFLLHADVNPFDGERIYVAEDARLYYTTDRSQTYELVYAKVPGACSGVSINNDTYVYYIDPSSSAIFRQHLVTGDKTQIPSEGCDRVIADETMNDRIFVVNSEENKMYFLNSQQVLYSIPGTVEQAGDIVRDLSSASEYWAVMNGSLSKVNIGNPDNITVSTIATPGTGTVSGIAITSGGVYVAKGNKVYRSLNGGTSWSEKSTGLGTEMIADIAANPFDANELILAAGDKIYRSTDAAGTWNVSMSGYTAGKVRFSPKANGLILAGIPYSVGNQFPNVIYSSDHGTSWKEIGEENLRYCEATSMDFYFGDDFVRIYASSTDMGRVSYQFDPNEDVLNPARDLLLNIYNGCTADLSWHAPGGNPQVVYNIYRDGTIVASGITKTSYMDSGFESGEHTWCVKAVYNGVEAEGTYRTASCIRYNTPRDINIQMGNIIGVGDCGIVLTWNTPNGVTDAVTYNIYRDGELIKSAHTSRMYEDKDFALGKHSWCVTAVYGNQESEGVCMDSECLLICEPPRDLTVKVTYNDGGCKAVLSWMNPEGYSTASYDIYRDGVRIATAYSGEVYTDTGFECGAHEWSIVTVCGDTESVASVGSMYCTECEDPLDIAVEEIAGDEHSVLLTWNKPEEETETKIIFSESFENGIPSTWKNLDKDGDGHKWTANSEVPYINDYFERYQDEYVYSLVEYIDPETFETDRLSPDNWLVTPAVTISSGNAVLKYAVALVNIWFAGASYEVYISTRGTAYEDFFLIYSETLNESGDVWYERDIDLAGYSGDIYIAFRHLNSSSETSGIRFDEIRIVENPFTYDIYRDGNLIAADVKGTSYRDENLTSGLHEWCIQKICAFGESELTCVNYTITGINSPESGRVSVYPNPTSGVVTVENGGMPIRRIDILDVTGKAIQVREYDNSQKAEVDLSAFVKGVYFIKVNGVIHKIVKK